MASSSALLSTRGFFLCTPLYSGASLQARDLVRAGPNLRALSFLICPCHHGTLGFWYQKPKAGIF